MMETLMNAKHIQVTFDYNNFSIDAVIPVESMLFENDRVGVFFPFGNLSFNKDDLCWDDELEICTIGDSIILEPVD